MNIVIEVEFLAGTSIEQSVMEARNMAHKLGLAYVKYKFNGVPMSISRRADTKEVAKLYAEYKTTDGSIVV